MAHIKLYDILQEIINEMLQEINPKTLASYIKKASKQHADVRAGHAGQRPNMTQMKRDAEKLARGPRTSHPSDRRDHERNSGYTADRRIKGVGMAADKLAGGTGKFTDGPSEVPANVQAAMDQGGKVVFGRYYDSKGNYLGKIRDGVWSSAERL
jgi:hypothetical protein